MGKSFSCMHNGRQFESDYAMLVDELGSSNCLLVRQGHCTKQKL